MSEALSQDEPIALEDVRKIIRLLGQIAGLDAPPPTRKRELMQGLSELVKADGWLWTLTRVIPEQKRPVSMGVIHGGLTEAQVAGFAIASQSECPTPEDPLISLEVTHGRHFTRTRQQIVPDVTWYSHPAVKQHRLDLGIDHFLYSIYPLPQSQVLSCLGFYRHVGEQAFSDRERRIVHIVTSEIDWLHRVGVPDDQGASIPMLPAKKRMVLTLLLEGHDRKTIARLLNIRPNTVKEHIDAVYEHFGVSSQVELICRFTRGDGMDIPAPSAK